MALALPCRLGQSLKIKPASDHIYWSSYDEKEQRWFEAKFSTLNYKCLETSDEAISERLLQIFEAIEQLKPGFWQQVGSVAISTHLEFPRNWGLGTSSTLIANLASWAKVNPYALLEKTFGGSGYDIACAIANGPLFYIFKYGRPDIYPTSFNPPFKQNLYFVYLGKKQNSREGIARYRRLEKNSDLAAYISLLSTEIQLAEDLATFEALLVDHEKTVADRLDLKRAKDLYFSDYWGEVKSLGAWGGDFVLVTSARSKSETQKYFNERGFETVLTFEELIKA
jgi:mevalonate kinase